MLIRKADWLMERIKHLAFLERIHRYFAQEKIVGEGAKDLRKVYDETTKGWSASKVRKHIASVPMELYLEMIKADPNFWSDRKNVKLFLQKYPHYGVSKI